MNTIETKVVFSSHQNEFKKPPYPVNQQVKFLHLVVEIELLSQQVQTVNRQRLTIANYNATNNKELAN